MFILLLTCHSTAMDEKEWIPHTTKTGKILYYINPATGECKWQSQLTKKAEQELHSKQLKNGKEPCTQEELSKEKIMSVPQVPISQETQQVQKPSVESKCEVSYCKREDTMSCSQLECVAQREEMDLIAHKQTDKQLEVPAFVQSNAYVLDIGEENNFPPTTKEPAGSDSNHTEIANSVSNELTVRQHKLECPQCHKQFSCPNNIASHLRSHPEIDPLKCPVCSKEYSSSTSLTTHLRIHTGERPFLCSHCHKSFNQSSHLTTHMRVHTGEKPYKCPKCPKTFGQSSHLTLHLRIHNGEKPFQCSFCTKGFSHSSALSTHIRTHTGEKPFQCPHCSKKFGQSSHLKIHIRTHTGERPFQCHHCKKCFRQSCYLAKHLRSHSSNQQDN